MKAKLFVFIALTLAILFAACAPAPTAAPTAAPPTAAPPPATTAPTAAAATTAPGGPTATRPPAPTPTQVQPGVTAAPNALKVQFWNALTGAIQVTTLQKFADQFNVANPQYFIVPTLQGNYDQVLQKMQAAITASATPDLIIGNPGDLGTYNTAGVMVALDPYINDPKDGLSAAQLAEMDPNLYLDKYDGKTIGVSFGRSEQVLIYNADVLKAAGFDKPPETWDDFDKVCAAVSKPPDFYCYAFVPSASTFAQWDWSRGGKYASDDEKKAVFDEPAGVETLTWLKNQADKKWAYAPSAAFGDQTDFGNGKVEFTFSTTAGLPFYNDAVKGSAKPFNWAIAPSPHGPNGKSNVTIFGPSIGIVKSTPEKQRAAWLFIKFLLSKDSEITWGAQTQYFPAPKSALDSLVSMTQDQANAINPNYGKVLTQYKAAVTFLPLGRREPASPAWQSVRSIIGNMMTAVFTGKSGADFKTSDPAGAAKEGVQRVNDALAQYGK